MNLCRKQSRLLRSTLKLSLSGNIRVNANQIRKVHDPGNDRGDDGGEENSSSLDTLLDDLTMMQSPNPNRPPPTPREKVKRKFFVHEKIPILLFPGQGSQFVGMGKKAIHYPGVKEMYEQVSDHFRTDILKLCLLGPKEELDKTINCQPAVFVTSLAALEMLKELYPEVTEGRTYTAGYSLGEITACVFAGVISFADALTLLETRAYSMQQASLEVGGGMMTMLTSHESKLGLAKEAAQKYCKSECGISDPVIQTASYLTPYHKVVAGHNEALDFINDTAPSFGLRGCKRLPVSGAFHSRLMDPARKELFSCVSKIDFNLKTKHRVLFNYTAKTANNVKSLKRNLCEQLVHPIQWEQIMQIMYGRPPGIGFPHTYEVGPGRQLGYILRLVNKKAYANYHRIEV